MTQQDCLDWIWKSYHIIYTLSGFDVHYSNGRITSYGGMNDRYKRHCSFRLHEGEVITHVDMQSDSLVNCAKFYTSTGRTLGPFGGPGRSIHLERHKAHQQSPKLGFLSSIKGSNQDYSTVTRLRFVWTVLDLSVVSSIADRCPKVCKLQWENE